MGQYTFYGRVETFGLNTRAVCFGSLAQRNEASRITINRFLDTMPDGAEQLKIFDINLRQGFYTKEILCDSMRRCNVLKINDEELVTISRIFGYPGIDLQDKCWILLAKYNLKMLILTCGTNGSYVFTPGVVSFQETPRVPVADTVAQAIRLPPPLLRLFLAANRCRRLISWQWKFPLMYVRRAGRCRNYRKY